MPKPNKSNDIFLGGIFTFLCCGVTFIVAGKLGNDLNLDNNKGEISTAERWSGIGLILVICMFMSLVCYLLFKWLNKRDRAKT